MAEKKKILIVDDDNFLLGMYAMKFQKNDFEVKTADNGEEAISILKEGYNPEVLIMDLVMPNIDGFATYERMKKENLVSNVVSVILTNQGTEADIQRARELGFNGYIVKATTIPSEVVDEVLNIYNKTITE